MRDSNKETKPSYVISLLAKLKKIKVSLYLSDSPIKVAPLFPREFFSKFNREKC